MEASEGQKSVVLFVQIRYGAYSYSYARHLVWGMATRETFVVRLRKKKDNDGEYNYNTI